jgi:hypothetical protein
VSREALLCAFLVLASGQSLSAQSRPVISTGALVRIEHTSVCCGSPVIGTLVSIETDSLRLVDPSSLQSNKPRAVLARSEILSIDVGTRIGSRAANGAVVGLIGGALAGAAIGVQGTTREFRGLGLVAGGGAGGILGLIVGTIIGSNIPRYEWTTAQLSSR